MKKKLAHGDIAGAFVSINLFALRSQLARVDPVTREKLQAAINTQDVDGGFTVLASDRRADFKAFTGQDMPADPAAAQTIWDAKTLEGHEAALGGYLEAPGVREALGAQNWDEAYRLAGDERTRRNTETATTDLSQFLGVTGVQTAIDSQDWTEAYRLAGLEATGQTLVRRPTLAKDALPVTMWDTFPPPHVSMSSEN